MQEGAKDTVIIRGGGDIASGTIQKLFNCGFNVLVLEIANPTAIRRKVSFCEAVYEGTTVVEGIKSKLVATIPEIKECWREKVVPVAVDPKGDLIALLKPGIVVDAILAKKNLGTNKSMAPVTIALGPGFTAGKEVDVVIETIRGHNLGRLIFKGSAAENTGIPGAIEGYSIERVVYSPAEGIIENLRCIGDTVSSGDTIAVVGGIEVKAKIDGVLRGLIRNNIKVFKNTKVADIDPGISGRANCFTITEKSRSIAGGVLEAILYLKNKEV
ncbi:MAG: selenium-dependent molybdenum cofactor biosynthesis protein YqeB [Clostridiaceae bacterium]